MQPSDRVAVLASHFVEHHTPQGQDGGLFRMHTSAVNPDATGATALPERLSDDSGWNVYRSMQGLLYDLACFHQLTTDSTALQIEQVYPQAHHTFHAR